MKRILVFFATNFVLGSIAFASPEGAANPGMAADNSAVETACSADAATAGCGSEKVGSGLLKCLHGYKKAHKADFKFSAGCKSAMKQRRADKKAGK